MLKVTNLTVRYGNLTIVDDVGFSVREQQWHMLVGPNGAGKSTIVNAIAQGVVYTGNVLLQDTDIKRYKAAERAQYIGILSQGHHVGYAFTVEEVVRLGRYPYARGFLSAQNAQDRDKVEQALAITGMLDCRAQSVLSLSGGELQRTFLAQVFAQDPKLLILDEPTNNLDLIYQKQIFELIRGWVRQPGRAVLSVVHDLTLAKAYGTHALLMHRGSIVASGAIGEALSHENLETVYSMDVYRWMRSMLSQWGGEDV